MARHLHTPSERRELRDPITGSRIEQLTTATAHHWHLAAPDTPLTPRGDYLLLVSDRVEGAGPRLFRREMRAGAIEQVTETDRLVPDEITPAANGRQAIALLRGEEGEVVAIDLETGECEILAVFLDAELEGCHRSASGEYVVTVVTREEEATITAVHTEGMRTVPILEGRQGIRAARFSPDARNSVVYVAADPAEIHCVEFDGVSDRVLWSGIQTFRYSGVQDRIDPNTPGARPPPQSAAQPQRPAPASRRGEARLPSPDAPRTLPHNAPSAPPAPASEYLNARGPIWLGSGDEVLYLAGTGPGPILAVPRQGGSPRVVSSLPCIWVRSAASGERLVVLVERAGAAERSTHQIMLIDPRSGAAQPLCSHCSARARPCFSPDSRSVVYAGADEHGFSQLYMAFLDEI